jgi:hypothetical protein
MSVCEACERGDHANCNLATWCQCDNEADGDELAAVASNICDPEQIAQLTEPTARFVERVQGMLENLNPTERGILERRFSKHPFKRER